MATPDDRAEPLAVDALALGPIHLRVRSLEGVLGFYEGLLGLNSREWEGDTAGLVPGRATTDLAWALYPADAESSAGGTPVSLPLLVLHPAPSVPPRAPGAPGLFHTAFLLPSRAALGRILKHLSDEGARLDGASDHLVSEALYLSDPEGNGVELYSDRPEREWQTDDQSVRMATLPIDMKSILEAGGGRASPIPAGTRVGHLHLRGPDLEEARRFVHRGLGLAITTEAYPGALFFSKGGYHHHLAVNRWGVARDAVRDPDAAGLIGYEISFPSEAALGSIAESLDAEGVPARRSEGGTLQTTDPNGVRVELRAGPAPTG